jgi:threonyl-tRNA synthetase
MKNDNLEHLRHSLAHLLGASVLELYPSAKLTLGPAIENGFYYDIDFGNKVPGKEDLSKIEKKMKELLPSWTDFDKKVANQQGALDLYRDNPYKKELIDDISEKGEPITLYTSGGFTDLCRGGHVENPAKEIDARAFKLTHVAGAYWRGDEKNKMLTRIYGLAFETAKELEAYEAQVEEAKKRDHRKLGKELDLFSFSEMVGAGLPLWSPRGTVLRNELQNRLLEISKRYGMLPVTIPHIAKRKLYETSGHAAKFGDELIRVVSHYDEFVMKPVNCPHHTQIYASRPRSYRDLPLRYMESTMQYRDEKPGEIGGLTRVRSITVDDGHIFCTPDQIKEEAKKIAHIIEEFYTSLGMFGNHWVSLSVRDPQTPDAYIGEPSDWEKAEQMLQSVSDELKLDAKRVEGEAAIYGPKLDYMFKDSLGREWQLGTIQIDFAMPKRFELEYTNESGEKSTPVMIHRAILGSYERFLAILIEHFAGAFPLWLSPVQVKVLPIGEAHHEYAEEVFKALQEAGIRAEMDDSGESLGKKIRGAKVEKVPYFLVIGDNEVKNNQVTLEGRDEGKVGEMSSDDLIKRLLEEIDNRV